MNESANTVNQSPELLKLNPQQFQNFWAKVNKDGPIPAHKPELGKCWLWTASKNPRGYGHFWASKIQSAHRVSYIEEFGKIPDGISVLHKCDVRNCVNPQHLFIGTQLDNVQDMISKGRDNHAIGDANGARKYPDRLMRGDNHYFRRHPEMVKRGAKHWSKIHPEDYARGEDAGLAKLTNEKVIEIRKRRAAGEETKKLGLEFGVMDTNISQICRGTTWKHVGGPTSIKPKPIMLYGIQISDEQISLCVSRMKDADFTAMDVCRVALLAGVPKTVEGKPAARRMVSWLIQKHKDLGNVAIKSRGLFPVWGWAAPKVTHADAERFIALRPMPTQNTPPTSP